MSTIDDIIEIVKDGLFPNRCLCGKWGETVCASCYESIPKNKKDLCPICRKLSEYGKTCSSCRTKSQLTGVMVFGKHEGPLKEIIWNYKYEAARDLCSPLSKLLLEKYGDFIKNKKFLITTVPISRARIDERGYNQAELIAKKLSGDLKLPFENLFIKENIKPQVGLSRIERIKNISGKIALRECDIKNKRILIVDDVYTTGSTLEECAKVLRIAGAREVWGAVLSRE